MEKKIFFFIDFIRIKVRFYFQLRTTQDSRERRVDSKDSVGGKGNRTSGRQFKEYATSCKGGNC